ncbi:MAG: inositol monophosphatase [Pseudomonadota bacterium]|nr:inositol monophosphatase [Pseudomonadota bacterium]
MSSPLLNVMSAAAVKAGKGLMRDFGEVSELQVSRKGPANFVTQSDIRTEKLLRRELEKARPDYGFLLEEGGEVPGKDSRYRWVIDPLDGTTNFIHAIPYFCISIALEERRPNGVVETVAGVIFDPVHNELFTAEKGKGALVNGKRLSVSLRDTLEEAMLVTGNYRFFAPAIRTEALALQANILQRGTIIRSFGATALDLANLAAGRIDVCWYYSFKPWDVAAGLLLLQEAGGIATQLDGQPAHAYVNALLASNRTLHAPMRQLLSEAA